MVINDISRLIRNDFGNMRVAIINNFYCLFVAIFIVIFIAIRIPFILFLFLDAQFTPASHMRYF